jgi:hypothetical protein
MYHAELSPNRVLERVASPHPFADQEQHGQSEVALENNEEHMLLEDLRNRMLHGRGLEGKKVEPVLASGSAGGRSDIARGLSSKSHSTLGYAIQEFFRVCFADLASHEIAIHEIAYERERTNDGLEPPDQFRLFRVDPRSIQRRWWKFEERVQYSSQQDRSEYGLSKYIPIRGDRFLVAQLPKNLNRPLQKAREGVSGADSHEVLTAFPSWERPEIRESGAYSLDEHTATREAVIARATRKIGWTGRGTFNEDASGHYLLRRRVQFERYVAALRLFLVEHLNHALEKAGSVIGIDAEVKLENAPEPSDYDEVERALEEGTKPFREILPLL